VEGPLDAYLLDYGEALTALDEAHSIAADEQVAACMNAQGFDYVPHAEGLWVGTQVTVTITPDWIAEHGYGIADGANSHEVGNTVATPDPNDVTYRGLSDAGRAAWDAALRGDPATGATGCLDAVDPLEPLDDPEYQRWQQARNQMDEDAGDDPEVVAALAAWANCMADAGHPGLASPADAWQAARDAADSGAVPHDELLANEIALATADQACNDSSGYAVATEAATDRLQARFVDEHRAELDAWQAAWATPSARPSGD
jgi:hypothetical protein